MPMSGVLGARYRCYFRRTAEFQWSSSSVSDAEHAAVTWNDVSNLGKLFRCKQGSTQTRFAELLIILEACIFLSNTPDESLRLPAVAGRCVEAHVH